METTCIEYKSFGKAEVIITANGVTQENLAMIDIGDLHLQCEGREYKLDYVASGGSLSDDGCTITFTLWFGTFEEAKSCFEDCAFDLTVADLKSHNLVTTVYIGSDDDNISDIKFVEGSIETGICNHGKNYEVKIDCDDSKNLIQSSRLHEILTGELFEIDGEHATMFIDFSNIEDANEFVAKYDDVPLIYNDIARDELDITVSHYVVIHDLLLLEEVEVIKLLSI